MLPDNQADLRLHHLSAPENTDYILLLYNTGSAAAHNRSSLPPLQGCLPETADL